MNRRLTWWSIGVIALITGTGAWAQEPGPSVHQLEEIIVSATRGPLARVKSTKSVAVIEAEDIERQHATTVLEVLRNVPGVMVLRSGGPGRTTDIKIRGAKNDQILVLIDGVEVASPTSGDYDSGSLQADFIERIEVLRGSASVMHGSKAMGGVVNIITKRGGGPTRFSYSQEFGSHRYFRETFAMRGGQGPLQYHVGLGRVDGHSRGEGNDVEVTQVQGGSRLQVTEWLELDTTFFHTYSYVGLDDGGFRPDPNRFVEREATIFSTTVRLTPLEWLEQEWRLSVNDDDFNNVDIANPGTPETSSRSRFNTTRIGMDWLNRLHLGALGLVTTGVDLRNDQAESTRFSKTIFNTAWFLQHQLDLTDRLFTIWGVRHNHHNSFGYETTVEASASYRVPTTETLLRVNYSQGFRAPDLNDLFFPNFGNSALQPESSDTYELGATQSWWQDRAEAGLTLFWTEVNDQIDAVVLPGGAGSQAQNIGEVELQGFELELSAQPRENLRLSAHWTYTDAEEEPSKEELRRTPANVVGLSLDYGFWERWKLNLNATLVDHTEERRSSTNRQRVKGYAKLDAALTCQVTPTWQVYGRIENLENRRYQEVYGFPAPGTLVFFGGKVEL